MSGSEVVHLNVGGVYYTTTRATLCRYPSSMLAAMFNGAIPPVFDENGRYFVDRNGSLFGYVLDYLRSSKLVLPPEFKNAELLLAEAVCYHIEPLIKELNELNTDLIQLNVGGTMYSTTKATLTRYPNSMLGAMFNGSIPTTRDKTGSYVIDRDGLLFVYILNFLRTAQLSLPEEFKQLDMLAVEADFYQIQPLLFALKEIRNKSRGEGRLLEVIEVRTGSTATMPTNNSRVKTIVSGRRDVIGSLPAEYVGPVEKLHHLNQVDFTELELTGSNVRLRLAEYLQAEGWTLVHSDISSSSGYDSKSMISSLIIEHTYRDRWSRANETP